VVKGGVDFVDLKEPGAGALGGLPIVTIRAIVDELRRQGSGVPVSATIGDVAMHEAGRIAACVDAVGACGVDYVKVGITRAPQTAAVLDQLAACSWAVVPVFIADQGLEWAHVELACALRFRAVMADTGDKRAGSLFDALPIDELRRFVELARRAGAMVGLAGALRIDHGPWLRALDPDFAGFRTAVCAGDRSSALDPQRLHALTMSMHGHARAEAGA